MRLENNSDFNFMTINKDVEVLSQIASRRSLILKYSRVISDAQNLRSDFTELPVANVGDKWSYSKEELTEKVIGDWENATRLNTGIKSIDRTVLNFNRGEVWYMAGRTGTKKTSLAIQILESITKNEGTKGIFFSLEMAENQLVNRMVEMYFYEKNPSFWEFKTPVESMSLCNRFLWENRKSRELIKASMLDFQICFEPALHLDKMAVWIRKYKREIGDISTIVIDYFQLLKGQGRDRREAVSQLARDLKTLAKSENIRIIALCQTSRNNGEGFDRVALTDLKESGDIEESADIVTGQWKDQDHRLMHFEVLKGRNGSIITDMLLGVNGVLFTDAHESQVNGG
jgi:replicative DNA helicase